MKGQSRSGANAHIKQEQEQNESDAYEEHDAEREMIRESASAHEEVEHVRNSQSKNSSGGNNFSHSSQQ